MRGEVGELLDEFLAAEKYIVVLEPRRHLRDSGSGQSVVVDDRSTWLTGDRMERVTAGDSICTTPAIFGLRTSICAGKTSLFKQAELFSKHLFLFLSLVVGDILGCVCSYTLCSRARQQG
jgi:hypothetical protein